MKTFFIVLLLLLSKLTFAKGEMGPSELLIKNKLTQEQGNIKVRIYPIGTFFRTPSSQNPYFEYSPLADENDNPPNKPYITSGEKVITVMLQLEFILYM